MVHRFAAHSPTNPYDQRKTMPLEGTIPHCFLHIPVLLYYALVVSRQVLVLLLELFYLSGQLHSQVVEDIIKPEEESRAVMEVNPCTKPQQEQPAPGAWLQAWGRAREQRHQLHVIPATAVSLEGEGL